MTEVLVAAMKIRPGSRADFEQAVRRLRAAAVAEPGVVGYSVGQSLGEPEVYVFTERYRDAEARQAHMGAPETKEFLAGLPGWLAEPVRVYVHHAGEPDELTIEPAA
ncbi:putative quinol monooxygenase [Amycolatopsis australiensis]|uniref:Quinol monooxygenase YgiN n=1 Tax=Amycolatopsis australiensis TaxID=546364 RepID=A0A1K1T4X0_9PSEU|nr:putative quinol monooxygenase [Amycolatopsis australiensis]SFW91681.1 Quinol monooxygenase YgiN [Amycolatopsis australiensis]